MSEFCDKVPPIIETESTWIRFYQNFYIQISSSKILVLMKSDFHVNNLTPSLINTKYKIFMSTHFVYLTNNLIYLALFLVPLK